MGQRADLARGTGSLYQTADFSTPDDVDVHLPRLSRMKRALEFSFNPEGEIFGLNWAVNTAAVFEIADDAPLKTRQAVATQNHIAINSDIPAFNIHAEDFK